MRWNPFRRKQQVETKAVLGTSDELGAFLMFGVSGSGETAASALSIYEKATAVSIPVNMVSESFAQITPVIKIGDEFITQHPLLDLLCMPSPFFTKNLFMDALGKNYLITGETDFVALGSVNRPPLELQPISPKDISVNELHGIAGSFMITGNTLTGSYNIARTKNKVRYLDGNLREFKQIRNFSTKNGSMLRGQSLLLAASAEARQHIRGNTHNNALLTNGGRMSAIFHFKSDLNTDDFEETKARVKSQYAGSENAGQIVVTSGEKLELHELGVSNKDMDYVKLQEAAKTACALQYKVPLPLIFIKASTFNNYREAKLALYDDAVLPLADVVLGGLGEFLMPRYGLDPAKAKLTYDPDQITALATRRNEELKLRRELNLESTNELRTFIGREDIGPAGDDILIAANMVPLGKDLFTDDNTDANNPVLARDED